MNKTNIEKYRHLIDLCRLIKDKDDYLARETGYNFNIFSILDREREEVRTHSYFLYELLNPCGSHNQGSKFVEIFLSEILDLEDMGNSKNIKVYRESLTTKNRRIDFIIECDTMIIGIEMKIDASDQPSQLYDYYEELECRTNSSSKDFKLFYLTLDGKDASVDSMQSLNQEDVINISFETTILKWLQECMESVVNISILREALYQYYILIEKIVGKKGTMMDEVSDLLLQNDNLAVAVELKKSIKVAKIKLQKKFWHLFINKLPAGFEFVNFDFMSIPIDKKVDEYYELSNNDRYYGIKCDIEEVGEYTISYFIELHHKIYHGVTVSKKSKRARYCEEALFIRKKELLSKQKIFTYNSSWWLARKHFNCSNEINFYNFNEFTLQINNDDVLNQYVQCLVNEVKIGMDKIKVVFSNMPIIK